MDMNVNPLYGVQNFLQLLNDNWTTILIIISLVITLMQKAKVFFDKSDDEKIAIAKKHIQEIMLKLVTDAETDYLEWKNAGSIKRAQVIEEIFTAYPILLKVTDQEELINWIDSVIDESLETMREVFAKNSNIKNVD